MSSLKIEYLPISALKPYERNPRRNDSAVDAVTASIREFGFRVPIVVDRDNVIVCGHTRYKAAQNMGLASVPCVVADDLTPEQIRAYRLADNKTAELSAWDFSMLEAELDALALESSLDMSDFGFEENESLSLMDAMSEQYGISGETAESDYSVVSLTLNKGDAEEVKSYIRRNGQERLTATVIKFVRDCNA